MVVVGQAVLGLQEFSDLMMERKALTLDSAALERIDLNFRFLKEFSSDKLIYGINTGFGPMAQYRVQDESLLQLQYNLVRSHSSGSGALLPAHLVRAIMIARLNSLMQGYSGVHTDVVELLKEMINRNIIPCIFEHGGVGASGDLVQLAHLGLSLIGEGEVIFEGSIQPAAEVFRKSGLKPLEIRIREGLAILNGTSAMTGIGMMNLIRARKLLGWSVVLSAMTNEIVEAFDDHYSHELNIIKHHKGQNKVAAMLRAMLKDSKMIRSRSEHLYHPGRLEEVVFEDKVQEYYSLRCITQVLGPIYDTIRQAEQVLTDELNSVNDNPVIDHINRNIFHGGNFHGDYVALEMDKLKIAITKLSMLSERQLNYLLNDKLNKKLPPFVNLGVLGLNFGMQGMQFTATSTVAENQTLSFPMYVHSIPNNNDNQDIVSMGCNAALMTRRVIGNSFEVLSVQIMTILQAVDYLECAPRLAPHTRSLYDRARKVFPKFVEDAPKYKELEKMKGFLESTDPAVLFKALAFA
ncbi:MAG: aromatic amino acid ammonia-lyase [Bacteroidota bacterium]|nr:aromatic amino acid ammonia-lyase [Bacteroidota bacterium]MDP4253356.1 aromatic amino acid ammonia-lyase [Bacteroidota bacterium]MDP4260034.1 aromatic amino acid ammonia-lyase [Bacteroidota bacterium]